MTHPGSTIVRTSGLFVLAELAAIVCAAAFLNVVPIQSSWLPAVLGLFALLFVFAFSGFAIAGDTTSLTRWEWGLLAYALVISLLRLAPYTEQYLAHRVVGAVTGDDNWHFQELASLVNTDSFPPHLNFRPDAYLHFYYLPWIPGAALSDILKFIYGAPCIKLTYGFTALLLNISSALILIVFLRHALEPGARKLAVIGMLFAGAVPDGFVTIGYWSQGVFTHSEWWQGFFGVDSEFSTLTTLFVWVPHHLIAAMSLLLAVVVATEPLTLRPRPSILAHVAAGLLLAVSLFSSIFAFIGGAIGLSPLLGRVIREPRQLGAMVFAAALVSTPLSGIYLHSSSANGFVLGKTFVQWYTESNSFLAGLAGLGAAALFMFVEVGWLPVQSFWRAGRTGLHSPLGQLALASSVYLMSTLFISFSGFNNYAMRGAIVPTVLLACYWAQTLTEDRRRPRTPISGTGTRAVLASYLVIAAVVLTTAAHLNEFALHLWSCVSAVRFDSETESCKQRIQQVNSDPQQKRALDLSEWTDCRDGMSFYSIERPFTKPSLVPQDQELMGTGPR